MTMRLTVALVAVLSLAACDLLMPQAGGTDLDGDWTLVGGVHNGDPVPIPDAGSITLTIDGSQVGGRAACNTYGGEMAVDGDRISIGAMSMTEMGCEPELMEAESVYVAAVADVERWSRDGDSLTLSGATVELIYELVPPTLDAALVGTPWRLDGLVDGDTASSTLGDPATLELRDDGTLSGTTGCRTFDGRYELEEGSVRVTELINDDRACPALATQDEHVLAVIGDGFAYAIDGGQLTLSDGRLGLVYFSAEG